MSTVLFLCSGNYYRSRFAEALFNHRAAACATDWRADSRGLRVRPESGNIGPISLHALRGLIQRQIPHPPLRMPEQVTLQDLTSAALIVALKEAEHRDLMRQLFPAWEHRIRYWHVHDLDAATPEDALAELEGLVGALLTELVTAGPAVKAGSAG